MIRKLGLLALATVALTTCGEKGVQDVPVPGWLSLNLSTPNADDGAIMFTVSGPVDSVRSVHPHVLSSKEGSATRVVIVGAIGAGALASIKVPDTRQPTQFTATVEQVAVRGSYTQRTPAGYTLVAR